MERLNPQLLERYHDGELSDRQRQQVEAHLERCPEDRAALARIESLSSVMDTAFEEQLSQVSFEGFEKRVMNSLERTERASGMERFKVWMSEVFEHRRRVWVPSAALAGAAAAMLLVIPLLTGSPQSPAPYGGGIQVYAGDSGAADVRSSEIVSVTGASQWAPYQVSNDRGDKMAVAWISE